MLSRGSEAQIYTHKMKIELWHFNLLFFTVSVYCLYTFFRWLTRPHWDMRRRLTAACQWQSRWPHRPWSRQTAAAMSAATRRAHRMFPTPCPKSDWVLEAFECPLFYLILWNWKSVSLNSVKVQPLLLTFCLTRLGPGNASSRPHVHDYSTYTYKFKGKRRDSPVRLGRLS